MSPALISTLIAAALGGGFLTEVFRSFRDRKRLELDLFYPTWKEEMARIHLELESLRQQVTLLSEEVRRLGGDPLAIRYKIAATLDEEKKSDK